MFDRRADPSDARIAVIGLGYVGLPLAVEFGRRFDTLGFDLKPARVEALRRGEDATGEVEPEGLRAATRLRFSHEAGDLRAADVFVVAVPTPIDRFHRPDLGPLLGASRAVGRALKKGDVVIFESTVYPGCTEEDCVPVLEAESGLRYNLDFFAGYSPERINPGDKGHRLPTIVKVTSGSTPEVARFVDDLYARIITAGTHLAPSIRVAEAAKIIENTQRDVNIALVNELSIVFSKLGIDTAEVLAAAATKWNWVNVRPGLVGGHCIGVDPYYLVHRASVAGHIPDIIRLSREINEGMARDAAARLVRKMIERDVPVKGARALVAGFTFKEDCPDTRNTKVVDLVGELRAYGMAVDIHDPLADPQEVHDEYGLDLVAEPGAPYDAVVLAVPHAAYRGRQAEGWRGLLREGGVLFDLKAALPKDGSDLRL